MRHPFSSWIHWLFLRGQGLRAGWRLLGHLTFVLLCTVVVFGATYGFIAGGIIDPTGWNGALSLALQAVILFLIMGSAHILSAWLLDARWTGDSRGPGRLRGVGIGGPFPRSLLETAGGFALGGVLLVPALAFMALGGVSVQLSGTFEPLRWLIWTFILYMAATNEELLFRGYGFQWLAASLGRLLSFVTRLLSLTLSERLWLWLSFGGLAVIFSLLFGLMHLANPSADLISSINTSLAGIWLALIVLRTRTLTWAIGAHLGWNHAQGLVFGTPLSGISAETLGAPLPSILTTTFSGASWLSGGGYGPEGSLGSTVAVLFGIGVAALLPRRPDAQSLLALVDPSALSEDSTDPDDDDDDSDWDDRPASLTWAEWDILPTTEDSAPED